MLNKICSCCKTERELKFFRKNGFKSDGTQLYKAKCKICKNASGEIYHPVVNGHKTCRDCKITKSVADFNKQGHRGAGIDATCKECRLAERIAKKSTIEGILSRIYAEQIQSTRSRQKIKPNMCNVDYSKEWLITKYKDDPTCISIHQQYIAGGMKTCDKLTIDRIDDDIGYTESNIQPMTVKQNQAKNGSAIFTRYHARKKGA